MKHHLIAMSLAAALLAACGDDPRGPLEVQGKTMLMEQRGGWGSNVPVKLEFSGREKGQIINMVTAEKVDFTYSLEGEDLVVNIQTPGGDNIESLEFELDGSRYKGSNFVLAEMKAEDVARLAAQMEELKQKAAKEQARKAEEERKAKEREAKLSPKGAPKDTSSYISITNIGDDSNDWGAWVYMAHQKPEERSDDELLRLFSNRWNSTKDSFERQAMRAEELSRIKQRLDEVRKINYVHFPWSNNTSAFQLKISQSSGGDAYDFEKKSFHLSGSLCSNQNYERTRSNVSYAVMHNPAFCWLPVPDEALARQIEAARTSRNGVHLRPEAYAKIIHLEDEGFVMVPVGLVLPVYTGNIYQRKPGEQLTQISLWPQH